VDILTLKAKLELANAPPDMVQKTCWNLVNEIIDIRCRKAIVEIWHEPNDGEAEILALQLGIALGKEGVGWDTKIMPFTAVRDPSMEIIRQDSGANGLAYAAKTIPSDRNSPLQVLLNAVELSLGGWSKSPAMFVTEPTLPDNHFVIAVGHHVVNVPLWSPAKPKKQSNSAKPKN